MSPKKVGSPQPERERIKVAERVGEWKEEEEEEEQQPFRNEIIKHATTENTLSGESREEETEKKKQRRGIMKLINRRTFFDLQMKPELAEIPDTQTEDTAEVSREEQSKKGNIFGLKFKNEKDFRR